MTLIRLHKVMLGIISVFLLVITVMHILSYTYIMSFTLSSGLNFDFDITIGYGGFSMVFSKKVGSFYFTGFINKLVEINGSLMTSWTFDPDFSLLYIIGPLALLVFLYKRFIDRIKKNELLSPFSEKKDQS